MNSNVLMQKLVLIAPLVARTVLYVLIGLSVLSIGVIIERWWFFRRRRDDMSALADNVRKALARGDLAEALLATAVGILVALPAVIYYNVFQKKGGDVEEGAAALGNVIIASMKAGVKPNGTAPGRKIAPSIEPSMSSNVIEMEA